MERFKGVITWTIDRYLGAVVTGVNAEALKMDLWNGHAELVDLQLREDMLQTIAGLPVRVSGTVGKVGVDVSRDGSIKLSIERVRALVTPLEGDEARAVRLREIKQEEIRGCIEAAVKTAVARGLRPTVSDDGEEGADAPTQGYLAQRISGALLESVELTVSDIQIAYDHGAVAANTTGVRLELSLGKLQISEAPPEMTHLQGVQTDVSFTRKIVKVESITAAIRGGGGGGGDGGGDDYEDDVEDELDESVADVERVLDVPELSVIVSIGNNNAEIVASLRLPGMKLHVRQPQLRAGYLLVKQYEGANARAKEGAAVLPELEPPSAAMQRLYIRLHQHQQAGKLSDAELQSRAGLEDKISAGNIAALRMEAEQSVKDKKVKMASEGWFAWANRVAITGSEPEPEPEQQGYGQPEPEPEPEPELFTKVELVELNLRQLRKRAEALTIDSDAMEDARDSENPKESVIALLLEAQDVYVAEREAAAEAKRSVSTLPSNAVGRWTVMWKLSVASVLLEVGTSGRGDEEIIDGMRYCEDLGGIHFENWEGTADKLYRKRNAVSRGGSILQVRATLDSLHVMDYFTPDTRFPAVFSTQTIPRQTRRLVRSDSTDGGSGDPTDSFPGFLALTFIADKSPENDPSKLSIAVGSTQMVCNMLFFDELNELFDATVDPEEIIAPVVGRGRAESIMTGVTSASLRESSPRRERDFMDGDDDDGGTTSPVADDPDWSSQTSDDGIEPRDVYRKIWTDENPTPEETAERGPGLIIDVCVRKPIAVIPEHLNKPQTMALIVKADRVLFHSDSQRYECKGNTHPVKERLRAWTSRIDKDKNQRFSCLEAEMPFTTVRIDPCGAAMECVNYEHLDSTTIRDVISEDSVATDIPQWDGTTPIGSALCQPTDLSLLIMLREDAVQVISPEIMPKFVVILEFRQDLQFDFTEETFVNTMGVFNGVLYSDFGDARDAKAIERTRPPPGGVLDKSHFQVLIEAKSLQVNVSTNAKKAAPGVAGLRSPQKGNTRELVRVVAEQLTFQFDSERLHPGQVAGGMDMRVSMQGLAARDCYSGLPDSFIVWVKKMRSRNPAEPVHLDFHVEGQDIDPNDPRALTMDDSELDGVKRLLKVDVNNAMKVSWVPETIGEIMRIFNRGVDRLFTPLDEEDQAVARHEDSPLSSPDRDAFPGNFLTEIDHLQGGGLGIPAVGAPPVIGKPASGRQVSWQTTPSIRGPFGGAGGSSERNPRVARPRSPGTRPPTLSRFIDAESLETTLEKDSPKRQPNPTSGESRYVLHVAEAVFLFEYPVGVPGMGPNEARPLVAVMQVKDSTVDLKWDFNESWQSVSVALNQVALSKTESECRVDPTISFSSTIAIEYRGMLEPLQGNAAVKAGHAFETSVHIPPLRFVCTPTSSPLVAELYSYMLYSFLYPIMQYDGEPVVDKTAPVESNFMTINITIENPRVLVTGASTRKGSYFFEAKLETLTVSSRLEAKRPRGEKKQQRNGGGRSRRGIGEVFSIDLEKFSLSHPGSGDVILAPMDIHTEFTQCFLAHPTAWTDMSVALPSIDINLPDSLPKFIVVVARDHIQGAAEDKFRGSYTKFVIPEDAIPRSKTTFTVPSGTLSYLKDGIRSASCAVSALSFTHSSDYGVQSTSLRISDFSVDAPHQHVLTRILHATWLDESTPSDGEITEDFFVMEATQSGNMAVHVAIPSSRAVLHADSMMYLKTIVDSIEEKEKRSQAGGLDDIVEEPDSPRAGDREGSVMGDSVMDDWDAPIPSLGSRSHGSESGDNSPKSVVSDGDGPDQEKEKEEAKEELPNLVTRSFMITAPKMELVIPETNRTDLLLFKFGVEAELSEIVGSEIRSRVTVQDLSASMGHWNRTIRERDHRSQYTEIQLDSILLRDFVTQCEYYRRKAVVNKEHEALSVAGKSMLTIVIGQTQVVASADQVFYIYTTIGNLLDEFLGDDEEFDDHVFAGDDPNAYDDHGEGYDDFDDGSLMSAGTGVTGKSGSKLHRSAAGSHMSSRMSEYSDSDWQTVASESDHGSYAMNSRHSRHARSSGGGSSDGESESGISQSFHSADDDREARAKRHADREELFSERLSQYSWERLSYDHRTSSGSDFSRGRNKNHGDGSIKKEGTASIFGVKISLPVNTTMRITCANMSLQLTSDPFGQVTPLWQMQVEGLSFAAKSKDAIHTLVTTKLTIQIKYFNLSVLCWESAIEPLLLVIDANRSGRGWDVDLNSVHNLNFNLSEALLQALEPLTDTTRSAPNSSAVETAPYRLKNYTGEPIQYTIGTEDSVDSAPALLSAGERYDYKIKDKRSDDAAEFTPRYITFRFEETVTERVCIDKPGKYMFSLQHVGRGESGWGDDPPADDGTHPTASYDTGAIGIFCEISKGETKGTREIVFGSPVTVHNKTNTEIELLVEKPMRSGPHTHATERIPVAPNDTQYIPVQYTRPNSGAALRVRPVEFGNESFWSQTTFNLRGLGNNDEESVGGEGQRIDMVCGYEDATRGQFCISAAMRTLTGGDLDTEQRVITLYPKLVINNLLPSALDYRFIASDGRVMELGDETVTKLSGIVIDENGVIEPNDSCTEFLHMESFTDWLFQVKIGDHEEWSEQVSVKVGAQRVFVQNDDSTEPLEVVIYGTMSNHASMELSISCPYWIINKTEDELSTRPWLNQLVRKQKKKRIRLEEKVTRLYEDYTAPFSCETDRFSVRVRGFDWSHGISLQTVGTTDFFLPTGPEGIDEGPNLFDGFMDDDFGSPHGSQDEGNEFEMSEQDLGDIEQGPGGAELAARGSRGEDAAKEAAPEPIRMTGKLGCHLGVNITTGSGPLSQTKIFTFTPFFRMDNQTGEDLLVRQRYSTAEDIMELRADAHGQAFQWSDMRSTKRVQIKFAQGDEWSWSGGIDIARHTGEFFVPLSKTRDRKATKMRTQDYIIRGEVKNTEQGSTDSMRMIVFNKEDDKFPPYLLLNACDTSVNVRQVGTDRVVVVQPGIVRPYACEEPFSAHMIEFWAGDLGEAPSMSLRLMDDQAVDVRATQVITASRGGSMTKKLLRVHVDCNGPVAKIRIEKVTADGQERGPAIDFARQPSFVGPIENGFIDSDEDDNMSMEGGDLSPRGQSGSPRTIAEATEENLARQVTFSRQGMMENVEEIGGAARRRGKDLLSGIKDVALETRGFVLQGLQQGGTVSKIARIGSGAKGVQIINVGMRFASVRISLIGAVTKSNRAPDRSRMDSGATTTTAPGATVRSEILLVVLDNMRVKIVTNDRQQKAELAVRYVQIDNQSHKTRFPVLLSIAAEDSNEDCMNIHVDRSEFNDRIEYFEYAAVQIQDEIHVQLEEEWLIETQSFLTSLQEQLFGKFLEEKKEDDGTMGLSGLFNSRRNEEDPGFGVGDGPKAAKNLYFDVLRLEPVRVKLDVIGGSTADKGPNEQTSGIRLPTVRNLQLRFTELQEKSPYGSAVHIVTDLIYSHYRRQFMRKIYKVLGGYLQGAQRGLVVNLGRGVYDCVRMPFIMTRKQVELMQACKIEALWFMGPVRGVVKGTTILFSNTVLGLTEFFTDVIGFFGAFFTKIIYGEQQYKLRRRNLMRSRPRHVFDGILLAVLVTSTAILSALYDVLYPFWALFASDDDTMTMREWVESLFQGVLGAFLKPIVGMLDGLNMILNGVGATVGVFGTNKTRTEAARKRQPRLFDVDGQLRPVNIEESECQNVLTQLGFINEVFIDNVRLEEYMVIVTSERLIWYLWDEKRKTEASRAQNVLYRTVMVIAGLSAGVAGGIELHYDDDRMDERRDMKFIAAAIIGIAFVFLLARILLYVKGEWQSPWKVGKVLFQSNFLWQVSWKNVEAVALDLPEELQEAVGVIGGAETPRWRASMRTVPGNQPMSVRNHSDPQSDDDADDAASADGEEAAEGGPPTVSHTRELADESDVSEVWAAAAQKAKAKERKLSAKERKANMPRLRFRLRQYEKYPRLNVSDGGAVTNFSGLSLQATNPYGFVWDTVYKRRERQITCSEDKAMGLWQLYDSLSSLKERYQSGGRTAGPLAAVLENVQFTDRMDLVRETGQEWAWNQAAPDASPLRSIPSVSRSPSLKPPSGPHRSARTPGAASSATSAGGTPQPPSASPGRDLNRTDSGRYLGGLERNLSTGSNGGLGLPRSDSLRDSGGGGGGGDGLRDSGGGGPGHRRVRSGGSDGAFDQVSNPLAYAHHGHHSAQPLRTSGLPLPSGGLSRAGHSVESGSGGEESMPLPFHISTSSPSEHNGFAPVSRSSQFGSLEDLQRQSYQNAPALQSYQSALDNQMEDEEDGPARPSLADNIRQLRTSDRDDDIDEGMVHENPLARATESGDADQRAAPLFNMGAVMSRDGGDGTGGSGFEVDHAELPRAGTGGGQNLRVRPVPLFMAAVADDDDLDGGGGGGREAEHAPRASAAVFEQEEEQPPRATAAPRHDQESAEWL